MEEKLNVKLREYINRSPFIEMEFENKQGKNKWNIILSIVDWIYVVVNNIEIAKKEYYESTGLTTCMKFYQYISLVDILSECIQQLNRVFFDSNDILFMNDDTIFNRKYFNKDDNNYFKELRAIFGAHSTNLNLEVNNSNGKKKQMFALWSSNILNKEEMHCLILGLDDENFYIDVNIQQIKDFYNKRYLYLNVILDKIVEIEDAYIEKVNNGELHFDYDYVNDLQKIRDGESLVEVSEEIEDLSVLYEIIFKNTNKQ